MAGARDEEWRGSVGKMTDKEIAEFLSGNPFCRIACLDDEGWPYVVPCWFEYRDGGLRFLYHPKSEIGLGPIHPAG
jgi:nitroimidazol reductase NimA-like FMN-containing flavoprotein (pyridoxamine 5'-phosphate oxidase superfamily)